MPGVSVGTGAGELVERFEPLAQHAFVVLPAGVRAVDPGRVSRRPTGSGCGARQAELTRALRRRWSAATGGPDGAASRSELLVNDLQPAAVSLCPAIAGALEALRAVGAEHALVSGSGPTVVGIWWGEGALGLGVEGRRRAACGGSRALVAAVRSTAEFAMPAASTCRGASVAAFGHNLSRA